MDAAQVSLLGAPLLRVDGSAVPWQPERRYQLLALLALNSGQWLARDQVAALLWPGHEPAQARRNLRKVVLRAREVPGAHTLEATEHALRWSVATDLQAFGAAFAAGRAAEAMALGRGPLLAGLDAADSPEFNEWLAGERRHWAESWRQAALAAAAAAAEPAERIDIARRLLAVDPLDEAAVEICLRAELALGHTQRAHRLYSDYAERLAEAFGVEPSSALRSLAAAPAAAAAAAPEGPAASAVDARAGEFIGRRHELKEIARWLARDDCRLLTLLGPGSIGKSSLARQAVRELAASYPGGTGWVELQDLTSLPAVVTRLAQVLGVQPGDAGDPLAPIVRHLQGGARRLLVLDNGEHLAELPALLDRLGRDGTHLQALLTSRVRSQVAHERLLALEGLAIPDEDSRDVEAAAAFDAIRLFERRAAAAVRGFELRHHLEAVIGIVEWVGGLPLAIELAAGWVRLLPPREILSELQQSIDVLEHDPAAGGEPARPEHHSMRAVLERSWQLLGPREREAMVSLAVFQGGFTRRAALEVAAVPLPLLSSLVDKSLLKIGDDGRFGMHPLVAADASARAAGDAPRQAALRDRHADFFAQQLAALAAQHTGDHRPIVAALEADLANCRCAWAHAIAAPRPDVVAKMSPAWRRYVMANGRFEDGRRHFECALALPERADAAPARAEARATLAWLAIARHDVDGAHALAREALAEAERIEATRLIADCSLTLGVAHAEQLRYADAETWFARALQVASQHGHRSELGRALNSLGTLAMRRGEHDDALAHYGRALTAFRDLGDHTNVARILMNSGVIGMSRLAWPAAKDAFEQALRYTLAHDVVSLLPPIEFLLGATLIELDELDAAANHLASARERCRALKFASYEIKTDYYLARIAARRGRHTEAAQAHLAAARTAHAQAWTLDLQYITLFVGELLREIGLPADAHRVLRGVAAAPAADASVGRMAEACLRTLPQAGGAGEPAAPEPHVVAFDAIASHLAHCSDLDDFLARLRALPVAPAVNPVRAACP